MQIWTAEKIKTLRQQLGWSAADFSRRFGCDLEIINQWERGEKSPSPEHVRQLESLAFHIDTISEQIQLGPQAEQILNSNGFEQIHRDQLKSFLKQ